MSPKKGDCGGTPRVGRKGDPKPGRGMGRGRGRRNITGGNYGYERST